MGNLMFALAIAAIGFGLYRTAERAAYARRGSEHEHGSRDECDLCRSEPIDHYMPGYFTLSAIMLLGGGVLAAIALLDALFVGLGA